MTILAYILLCICSGILYRMGGYGKPFNTLDRDIGCSICLCILLYALGLANTYWVILTFGLCWGALTTYHKWLNKLFGEPKDNAFWFNWLIHGFCIGLSIMPVAIIYGKILPCLWSSAILGISMMVWSDHIDKDWLEEFGRGFLMILVPCVLLSS